jgi:hypothetical protein
MSDKVPYVRQIAWLMVIPQLLAMAAAAGMMHLLLGSDRFPLSVVIGIAVYLVYSFGSRIILLADHKRGIACFDRGEFEEAITYFEKSYAFLTKYWWIDHFRPIVLMSPSGLPYREMALVNLAGCHTRSAAPKMQNSTTRRL